MNSRRHNSASDGNSETDSRGEGGTAWDTLPNLTYTFAPNISDMRMPGMDGAELLTIVAEKYPTMIRVILSGQSEQDSFERAVENAQHYLSKPCSLVELDAAISQ